MEIIRFLHGISHPQKNLVTTTTAAKRLGISRHAVIALIKRGSLPAEKIDGQWKIDPDILASLQIRKPGRPKTY